MYGLSDGPHFYHRELLGHLSDEQFEKLERALCSAEGLGTLNRNKKDSKQKAASSSKKAESLPGEEDATTSTVTPLSEPSASSPERVFEPRPPQSSREGR